jgi:hypothetical protein
MASSHITIGWGSPPRLDRLFGRALAGSTGEGKAPPLGRPGTILVREWQGTTHHVTVVAEGFVWNGRTHSSLSGIAGCGSYRRSCRGRPSGARPHQDWLCRRQRPDGALGTMVRQGAGVLLVGSDPSMADWTEQIAVLTLRRDSRYVLRPYRRCCRWV